MVPSPDQWCRLFCTTGGAVGFWWTRFVSSLENKSHPSAYLDWAGGSVYPHDQQLLPWGMECLQLAGPKSGGQVGSQHKMEADRIPGSEPVREEDHQGSCGGDIGFKYLGPC